MFKIVHVLWKAATVLLLLLLLLGFVFVFLWKPLDILSAY
jgi:hypothetical protein